MQWELRGAYAWVSPFGPALCFQTTTECATVALVHEMHDLFHWLQAADIENQLPEFSIFHDWRSVGSLERGARQAWMKRGQGHGDGYRRTQNYIAISAHPILRMALSATALSLQLATGQRAARISDDLDDALRAHRVAAPPVDFLEQFSRSGDTEPFVPNSRADDR